GVRDRRGGRGGGHARRLSCHLRRSPAGAWRGHSGAGTVRDRSARRRSSSRQAAADRPARRASPGPAPRRPAPGERARCDLAIAGRPGRSFIAGRWRRTPVSLSIAGSARTAGLAVTLSWGWKRAFVALASGAASSLAMEPFNAWPLLFVTFPVATWLIDGSAGRLRGVPAAALAGWLFGFGYFVPGLYWIGNAFLVDAQT